jgi:hypothetical protein
MTAPCPTRVSMWTCHLPTRLHYQEQPNDYNTPCWIDLSCKGRCMFVVGLAVVPTSQQASSSHGHRHDLTGDAASSMLVRCTASIWTASVNST